MNPCVLRMSCSVATDNVSINLFSVMNRLTVPMVPMRMLAELIRILTVLPSVTLQLVCFLIVSAPPMEPESLEILIQTKYLK